MSKTPTNICFQPSQVSLEFVSVDQRLDSALQSTNHLSIYSLSGPGVSSDLIGLLSQSNY